MKGHTLADQLGMDLWIYSNNDVPLPTTRTEWDLNALLESILNGSAPSIDDSETDYNRIAGTYSTQVPGYGEANLVLNPDKTFTTTGLLGNRADRSIANLDHLDRRCRYRINSFIK